MFFYISVTSQDKYLRYKSMYHMYQAHVVHSSVFRACIYISFYFPDGGTAFHWHFGGLDSSPNL